ncbi:MAG: hypothetical protein JRG92_22600 [Deltaproteobacteria bacterium]|nr:hypothetical protein [Deltaproteobacteria bacterium]MBW2386430.1 hypothetical protein [Deltaproteobacteria bacterium]MBW2696162.1 hypothetical protein [Deltaproteobacteria bacterium]
MESLQLFWNRIGGVWPRFRRSPGGVADRLLVILVLTTLALAAAGVAVAEQQDVAAADHRVAAARVGIAVEDECAALQLALETDRGGEIAPAADRYHVFVEARDERTLLDSQQRADVGATKERHSACHRRRKT